ncbi:MAG: DNRLRE domain-containing protein, partial [Actinobacteria bacterium]|nr:DNRLRE domain-containing protein [Actinomycetota bacterium]
STTWSETAVTWTNQPAIQGAAVASLGSVSQNTWYELDVTSAITGNGTFSLGMTSTSADGADYDSRETGATSPQLVVTTGATTTTAPATTTTTTPSGDPVLVGAGDIAGCSTSGDEATATLLDSIPGTVFTTGDNVYDDGTASEFANCYDPTWGRHKARTRPSTGNHDYHAAGAVGYFGYFGAAAGDPAKGYYSYDLGNWHVVAINSNCSEVGGCGEGSPQETWLRQNLAETTKPCTVAYWHHPLFTSGANHSNATQMRPIFQALYDFDAEVVLAGHNHNYERFAPQNPSGGLDTAQGIRGFVVGTGGGGHYGFGTIQPNSEVRNGDTYGVLKLTLKASGYDWQFVPKAGYTFTDAGSGTCH